MGQKYEILSKFPFLLIFKWKSISFPGNLNQIPAYLQNNENFHF